MTTEIFSVLNPKTLSQTRSLAVSGTVCGIPLDKFINLVVLDLEGWENLEDENLLLLLISSDLAQRSSRALIQRPDRGRPTKSRLVGPVAQHYRAVRLAGFQTSRLVSPHSSTIHQPAATVFLSHTTSRYSVLASFFQTSERGHYCIILLWDTPLM